MIILSGNKHNSALITNINSVRTTKSSNIVNTKPENQTIVKVFSTKEIKNNNGRNIIEFKGTLTGYGPDCPGCLGMVYCAPNPDVRNGNIYYTDKEYGKIRILAADYAIPCGSIIRIENFKFIDGPFIGIVLDRGSSIVGLTMDLLYPSEDDTVIIGRAYDINFQIVRWGWQ